MWSTIFGALFLVRGWTVAVSIAVAVLSHFLLDAIVNSGFALWPGSSVHLGLGLSRTLPTGSWVVELQGDRDRRFVLLGPGPEAPPGPTNDVGAWRVGLRPPLHDLPLVAGGLGSP